MKRNPKVNSNNTDVIPICFFNKLRCYGVPPRNALAKGCRAAIEPNDSLSTFLLCFIIRNALAFLALQSFTDSVNDDRKCVILVYVPNLYPGFIAL